MPKHINDHGKRQEYYREKGSQAMKGKTMAKRFQQHVDDTVENVLALIDHLEDGTATFEDARIDLASYKQSASDIWLGIEHGVNGE